MSNHQGKTVGLTGLKKDMVKYVRLGWNDVVTGNGFHLAYDKFHPANQHNYEVGRLWALEYKLRNGKVPAWIGDTVAKAAHEMNLARICPGRKTHLPVDAGLDFGGRIAPR